MQLLSSWNFHFSLSSNSHEFATLLLSSNPNVGGTVNQNSNYVYT